MGNNLVRSMLMVTASVSAAAIAAPTAARAQEQGYEVDIPAQPLGDALRALGRETRRNIVFDGAAVRGKRSVTVRGRYTAREALDRLLAGSGLTVSTGSGGVLMVKAAGNGGVSPSGGGSALGEDGNSDSTEIVVTGSRLQAPTGSEPIAYNSFDRNEIESFGVTAVADVLNYLPQQSYSFNEFNNFAGSRDVQLRGLGFGTTLVLINGQRTISSALQGSRNSFDLNTIPLAAVDRIEILSDSASAVYGADAVGGVVNVILKKSVDRPTIDLYHGGAKGGADENRASFTFGINRPRFRSTLVLDIFHRSRLMGTERDLSANVDFRRFGGTDSRNAFSNPGNITSTTTANLPGLPSRIAAVPVGSSGTPTIAMFLPTAGQTNLEQGGAHRSIIPESRRWSGLATAAYDLTDNIEIFVEGLYNKSKDIVDVTRPLLVNRVVPASNAFNPFGVPVSVSYLFDGLTVSSVAKAESLRLVAGLRGRIASWRWEASVLRMDDKASSYQTGTLDATRLTAALASSDPAQALNVFIDGPAGSQALLTSLLATPVVSTYRSKATQGSAFASGSLFSLPAGDLALVIGGEVRRESLDFLSSSVVVADRDVTAGFVEARVPLVVGSMNVPLIHELTLTAAGRLDHYSDFGTTVNPQVSLDWRPAKPLRVRATYGTSFRPPSLFQLYSPATEVPSSIADPRRGNVSTPFTLARGGNPNLDPEEAAAWSIGFSFEPPWWSGGRFAASAWNIKMKERTQVLGQLILLANEDLFPDRVIRAAPTAADIAAGQPGSLLRIDTATLNYGELRTSGIDFQASQAFDTGAGRFNIAASATWVSDFEAANLPNTPPVERVGIANTAGTIPEWRATLTLAWNLGPWSLATTYRYVSSYEDATSGN